MLLLHGGPGATHEYFEAADSYFPAASVEYYYYDQLGSAFSDQPKDESLWDLPRFVEEVEQVRSALGLNKDNFYLLGQSWGGMLAIEYALKYQQNLKGLIISNMMASIPAYNEYANKVLMPAMSPDGARGDQGARGEEAVRQPALHGAADPEFLRRAFPAHASRSVARSGHALVRQAEPRRST